MNRLHYYDLGYTEVFVFESYLINQIKEGETVVAEHAEVLQDMIDKHFSNQKMVYISNRINSYSVDPLVYLKVAEIDNLLGMGIVVYSDLKEKTAQFEKNFCSIPYQIFSHMTEAIIWATDHISQHSKKSS